MLNFLSNVDDAFYWFMVRMYRGFVFFLSLLVYPKKIVDGMS